MLGKILIVIGILLIVASAVIYICALPIFNFTSTTTQTGDLPPLQKSEIIMNYEFVLPGPYSDKKEVQVPLTTDQTLNVLANANNGYYFQIVKHQTDGIDAIFMSSPKATLLDVKWTPTVSDTYAIIFSVSGYSSSDYATINANVTKTWTVAQTRTDTITTSVQKPLIDFGVTQINYLVSGIAVLGCVSIIIGGYAHYKIPSKKNKESAQPQCSIKSC